MGHLTRMRWLVLLMVILFNSSASAGGVAALEFHMGLGAEGTYFVVGTISNSGDDEIKKGYLVILPVTTACEPEKFVLHEFSALMPGDKSVFRVPVQGRLPAYRVVGFGAVDSMGYELPTTDATKKILLSRRGDEIQRCKINAMAHKSQ